MTRKEKQKLYASTRWRSLRHSHIMANPLCAMCLVEGRLTAAQVVDHVKPHRGNLVLFFDAKNLQSLCASHHNAAKQREESGGDGRMTGLDGWPVG